eukprot:8044917-Pyramimonas_sp.AAC.1
MQAMLEALLEQNCKLPLCRQRTFNLKHSMMGGPRSRLPGAARPHDRPAAVPAAAPPGDRSS